MEVTTSKINKLTISDQEKESLIFGKYLPPEVWTLVLVRLPVRILLRLRCVCKSWCSVIDDPNFVSLHLTLFNNNGNKKNNESCRLLMIARERDGENGENAKLIVDIGEIVAGSWHGESARWVLDSSIGKVFESCFRVLGFSNGVLLMERWTMQISGGNQVLLLMLWNPITGKSVKIPGPIMSDISVFNVGVGFDPSSNDVKVVAILDPPGLLSPSFGSHNVAIYSLRSGTWRTKKSDVKYTWYYMAKPLVSGGALHWLARVRGQNHHSRIKITPTHIASFHLDTETFTFTALPTQGETIFPLLVDESLAIIDVPNNLSISPCHIWVMKHEQEKLYSWTRWYSTYPPLTTACQKLERLRFLSMYVEIFVSTATKLLIVIQGNEVDSYKLEDDGVKYLGTCFVPYSAKSLLLTPHVESLLLNQGSRFTP